MTELNNQVERMAHKHERGGGRALRFIFEWDPEKARENLRNHHLSFERAATIFRDSQALSIFDVAHNHEEDRWITLGLDRMALYSLSYIPFTRSTRPHAGYASSQLAEPPEMK